MRWLAPILALGLAGCIVADEPDRNACGAGGMQGLVGQSRAVLAAMTLPSGTRIIEPGMAITEDYRPERMNVEIGEDGRIARIWCG